ncbi:MAG: hypothetical protein H6506_00940 [Calditrichaeota bacterium]|nr:hypothetical protein [Calditrichota bacterium]MCB9366540.1 hypothetical protein [Calditrichota bacterium]MCB9391202.1 hypothetical protein [Calditrichota bacterium]
MKAFNSISTAAVFLALILSLGSACRNKTSTGPNIPPDQETFILVMDAPDTIRYGVYTTIPIRLFKGDGMAISDTLLLLAFSGVGYMHDDLVIPQSDTINVNGGCGANPCVRYRCDDTTLAKDSVLGYAISNGDTVAYQATGFFLSH